MVAVSYGTATGVTPVVEKRASMAPLKMAAGIMAGLMAAAMVAAMVTSQQESPAHFKSELLAYRKVVGQTQMLDSKDFAENADGEDVDDENTAGDGAYECCWHAPNAALARSAAPAPQARAPAAARLPPRGCEARGRSGTQFSLWEVLPARNGWAGRVGAAPVAWFALAVQLSSWAARRRGLEELRAGWGGRQIHRR